MELFDRIFRQPCSQNVAPEENLATEITAFLLERHGPFRSKFLSECGVTKVDGKWEVSTQESLPGPGQGKIPDLKLRRADGQVIVLVEVKIDSGTTYDRDGRPQTEFYRCYLDWIKEQRDGPLEAKLVTLTRWSPDPDLARAADRSFRFAQIAQWLEEPQGNEVEPHFIGPLGRHWANYLRQRRWAMNRITGAHLQAMGLMNELLDQVNDLVQRVTQIAADDGNKNRKWKLKAGGRTSYGACGSGRCLWGPPIVPTAGDLGEVQVGGYFGIEGGQPFLRPVIFVGHKWPEDLGLNYKVEPLWERRLVLLTNIADKIGTGEDPIDSMKSEIEAALDGLGQLASRPTPTISP